MGYKHSLLHASQVFQPTVFCIPNSAHNQRSNYRVYWWVRQKGFPTYISGSLHIPLWQSSFIWRNWSKEEQCWGAQHTLQFLVQIYSWSARFLIHVRCELQARLLYKNLRSLNFPKTLWALCSRSTLLGNEGKEYSIISRGKAMALVYPSIWI